LRAKDRRRSSSILLGLLAGAVAAGAVTPMTASAVGTRAFAAEADAEVVESKADDNFGSAKSLHSDGSPETESYLRFVVEGVVGTVQRATLRLYVTNGSSDGPVLYAADSGWSESAVNWESRPGRTGEPLEDKGKVRSGWVEYDVSGAVKGNGTVAFNLTPESGDGLAVNSREASRNRPELRVETGEAVPSDTHPPDGAPNVLIILTDDQRADQTMEVMERTRYWLGEGGTTFGHGFATTPLCCPSRSTLFSGRYMHNHGVFDNGEAEKLDQRFTMQRYLHDAGYQTAMVGKFLTGWSARKAPPNFDHFALSNGGYRNVTFNVDGHSKKAAYTTDFLRDQALEFLGGFEADDSRPWFLYLAPQAPHDDDDDSFPPAPRHEGAPIPEFQPGPATPETDKSDKVPFLRKKNLSLSASKVAHDGQLRTLLAVDEMIDAVFQRLEASGEADNTLVVFTSDNGYHWGEHGVSSKGLPYNESVRVPFMVRWPGRVEAGAVSDALVGGIDLMPTVLEATGTTPPVLGYPLDGRSLFAPGERERILLEFHAGHRDYPSWASIRTHTNQYLEYYANDDRTVTFREHYDLVADPYQLDNVLADDDPANDPDVDALSAELKLHRACQGATGTSACP
jgi:arylsulfatase A-like enzyme